MYPGSFLGVESSSSSGLAAPSTEISGFDTSLEAVKQKFT
jgi:hypothetical protein